MYILQKPLLSFEQFLELDRKNRLVGIFSTLDLSSVVIALDSSRCGPKGYPIEAMVRSLIAKQVEGIPTVAKLVERLRCDPAFRYWCGFSLYGRVPSEATFSRFLSKLAETGVMETLFQELVAKGRELGIIGNEDVAVDSTEIDAYERAKPKKECTEDGNSAAWGSKRDTHGNQINWFGYKTHIACDCQSELPVAIVVTPANVHDSKMALPLIEKVTASLSEDKWPKHWIMDSAYDVVDIYRKVHDDYHAQAIIPLNTRGTKEPPEGFDFDGTPICSMGYRMAYWGYDAEDGTNKFRCPHVVGKVDCPQGSCWCSSSSYGRVVKTRVAEDPRRFCAPHRGSRTWQYIYDRRTSAERCFSRLKENLGANNLRVCGIKKVLLHQVICSVALIAGTLAVNILETQRQKDSTTITVTKAA